MDKKDIDNLCSRKLFELISRPTAQQLSAIEKTNIELELLRRNHYINELETLSPIEQSFNHQKMQQSEQGQKGI